MTSASLPPRFVARSATDLVAIVPVVLGFHPRDSVVLLTFGGPVGGRRLPCAGRPARSAVAEQEEVADLLVGAVAANRVERVAVLLYTDDVEVAHSQATLLLGRLLDRGVEVIDVLRVDDGRWHSVPEDGSPGTAYDLEGHPFTAQGVFEGQVVHRDRAELADTLVGTDEEDAVEVALAATRFADLVALVGARPGCCARRRAGCRRFIRSHLDGRPVAPVDAGRLLVLASLVATRDVAWAEITRESSGGHVELWRGLVRRAPRDLLPGRVLVAGVRRVAARRRRPGLVRHRPLPRGRPRLLDGPLRRADPDRGGAAQRLGADPRGRPAGLRRASESASGRADRPS